MHRKSVTSELHDSYFRSMTIKHAIQKTAEEIAGRGDVSICPRGSLMVI